MGKEIINKVQEVQRVPARINPTRSTPRHIVIKLTKLKTEMKYLKQQGKNNKLHIRELPSGYHLIFQQKLYKPEGNGMIYLK